MDAAPQRIPERIDPFAGMGGHRHGVHLRAAILAHNGLRALGIELALGHHQHGPYAAPAGSEDHAVQQQHIRLRRCGSRHNHDHINIRHRRAHQLILPGQDGQNPAVLLARAGLHFHTVAHLGLHPVAPELALCAQDVHFSRFIHRGIKAADAPQNDSLQGCTSTFSFRNLQTIFERNASLYSKSSWMVSKSTSSR